MLESNLSTSHIRLESSYFWFSNISYWSFKSGCLVLDTLLENGACGHLELFVSEFVIN